MGWFRMAFETLVRLAIGRTGGVTTKSGLRKSEVPALLSKQETD